MKRQEAVKFAEAFVALISNKAFTKEDVEATLDQMVSQLKEGKSVRVPGMGVFSIRRRTETLLLKPPSALSEAELKKAIKQFTTPAGDLDVKAIRESLAMSQSEFSAEFKIPAGTLKNWEQGISKPRDAALLALVIIALEPDAARRAIPLLNAIL